MQVEKIDTTLYRVPLAVPVQAASTGLMCEFDLVTVRVRDSDGTEGCGYTVLHAGQGQSIVEIATL